MSSAQDELLAHVRSSSDCVAFVERNEAGATRHVRWTDLERWSTRWMRVLATRGIQRGARVAVQATTSLELVAALVAHHRAGVIHVPINTRYKEREVAHIMEDSGATVLIDDAALAEMHTADADRVSPLEDVDAHDEDTALLIYTSGTTGKSKGVELPFRAIARGIGALTGLWRWTRHDRLALALPLFHVHGLCIGVHGTLLHGMSSELQTRFEPSEVVGAFERGATIFMGVPTMYARLLRYLDEHPERATPLRGGRLFTSGSAALPAADHERFRAHTDHSILERYGMSETLLTLSNPYEGERRPGSVGFAVPGTEVRVVDEHFQDVRAGEQGEIVVRGPSVMTGYFGNPSATEAAFRDGWFLTGDAATRDRDGYLRISGRKSVDILKSGGFKISAREIEEVILEHPQVAEAAVVGLPDSEWGQRIAAVVVAVSPDASQGLDDAVARWCEARLAGFKKPREVTLWDALPRNALGKLQKHRIVRQLASDTES